MLCGSAHVCAWQTHFSTFCSLYISSDSVKNAFLCIDEMTVTKLKLIEFLCRSSHTLQCSLRSFLFQVDEKWREKKITMCVPPLTCETKFFVPWRQTDAMHMESERSVHTHTIFILSSNSYKKFAKLRR